MCELFNEVFEDHLDEINQRIQTPALVTYSEIESGVLVYGIMMIGKRVQPEIEISHMSQMMYLMLLLESLIGIRKKSEIKC